MSSLRYAVVDVVGALVMAAALFAEAMAFGEGPVVAIAVALPALGLAARRSYPELVPVLFLVLLGAAGSLGISDDALQTLLFVPVWLVGAFSAAAHRTARWALIGLGLWVGVAWGLTLRVEGDLADLLFNVALVVGGWLPGFFVRLHHARADAAEHRAEAEREAAAESLVAERARIARELHDVVAHAVGIMVVQAASAEQNLDREPARAKEALATVQNTGRTAVAELARMLGLLRGDEDWERAPLPTLATLESLVADTQAAGSTVTVAVRQSGDALHVEVVDFGGTPSPTRTGTGHGLTGLRERASIFGGTLEAGPTANGFRVHATLPITEAS